MAYSSFPPCPFPLLRPAQCQEHSPLFLLPSLSCKIVAPLNFPTPLLSAPAALASNPTLTPKV